MRRIRLLICLLAVLTTFGCHRSEPMTMPVENTVYYWRTTWRLDSVERAFLQHHSVQRVYCRFFDVVMRDGEPMPQATLSFVEAPPAGLELIPTVFITEDCMRTNRDSLAPKLLRRILQMCETHDVAGVREVQIDCDYTDRSRYYFYHFLEALRHETDARDLRLSATIRLHQLAMAPPPVDYGVLMLYNTGDPRRFDERNPVLDRRDVQPYVSRLSDYALPLAAAYPVYRWLRTIYGVRVEHTVAADEILAVKQMVERKRPELARTIITYHLDNENINRYKTEDYEAFYHH